MPDTDLTGQYLYRVWQRTGKSKREVGEMHGLTYGQCAGRIWRYMQTLDDDAPEEQPGLFHVVLGAPLDIDLDDVMIVNDVHTPTTNLDMARLVGPTARQYGISVLIINGDLLNVDWLSSYPVLVPYPSGTDEIEAAKYLLEEWLRVFSLIYFMPGNHEDRFLKTNNGHMHVRALLRMLTSSDRVVVSNYDHMFINTASGRWLVAHGRNYSVHQLNVADQMAQKYDSNVILGHQHHLAMGWDRYKRHIIIDNGGLFDTAKMGYVRMRAGKNPGMMNGFSVLKGGYPMLFGPEPFTNWEAILDNQPAQAMAQAD